MDIYFVLLFLRRIIFFDDNQPGHATVKAWRAGYGLTAVVPVLL